MTQPSYRAAIVGTGAIAGAHATTLRAHAGRVRLTAVVDVDADRARAFADRWAVPTVAPGVADLLADCDTDLVHLCTPPSTHLPLALECPRAGVAVLVEKPPALSLAELDTMVGAAAAGGAHLATVFQQRFGAGAARLRATVAAGEFGRPLLATCDTRWYRDDAYYDVPWRGDWDTEGGGPTMGHGIHQFDLLLSVLGPWEQVTAVAARRSRPVRTEDVSMALVTAMGRAVRVHCGRWTRGPARRGARRERGAAGDPRRHAADEGSSSPPSTRRRSPARGSTVDSSTRRAHSTDG